MKKWRNESAFNEKKERKRKKKRTDIDKNKHSFLRLGGKNVFIYKTHIEENGKVK